MYAHLDRLDVAVGTLVHRGRRIGSVGSANGYYPAHLHFEVRHGDGADIGARCELLRGARVWPGILIPDCGIRYSSDI